MDKGTDYVTQSHDFSQPIDPVNEDMTLSFLRESLEIQNHSLHSEEVY
jgi:hypothetical protein